MPELCTGFSIRRPIPKITVAAGVAAWRVGFAPWWSATALVLGLVSMTVIRFGGLTVLTIGAALLLVGLTDLGRRLMLSADLSDAAVAMTTTRSDNSGGS